LIKKIKPRLKEILFELCEWQGIKLLEGSICSDHVHLYLSVPPKLSVSKVMQVLKGKSSERLRKEFVEIRSKCWEMHIWTRGYFVSTVGFNSENSENTETNDLQQEQPENDMCPIPINDYLPSTAKKYQEEDDKLLQENDTTQFKNELSLDDNDDFDTTFDVDEYIKAMIQNF